MNDSPSMSYLRVMSERIMLRGIEGPLKRLMESVEKRVRRPGVAAPGEAQHGQRAGLGGGLGRDLHPGRREAVTRVR